MKGHKSWEEKLNKVQDWKVVDGNKRYPGQMLIPTPKQVDAAVCEIPLGAVSTPALIRQVLAARCGADTTCPLCVGIFLRISAEAAAERSERGSLDVTPYWRVVDGKGRHYAKWPGGREGQDAILQAELGPLTLS